MRGQVVNDQVRYVFRLTTQFEGSTHERWKIVMVSARRKHIHGRPVVYEEIGTEAFPALPQEGLCRTLIPLRVGAQIGSLNYGRHRRWANTKCLLNAGDERHKVSN